MVAFFVFGLLRVFSRTSHTQRFRANLFNVALLQQVCGAMEKLGSALCVCVLSPTNANFSVRSGETGSCASVVASITALTTQVRRIGSFDEERVLFFAGFSQVGVA